MNPFQVCRTCNDFQTVVADGRGFPPDIAKNKLKKRCEEKGCKHNIVYRAGFMVSVDKSGF